MHLLSSLQRKLCESGIVFNFFSTGDGGRLFSLDKRVGRHLLGLTDLRVENCPVIVHLIVAVSLQLLCLLHGRLERVLLLRLLHRDWLLLLENRLWCLDFSKLRESFDCAEVRVDLDLHRGSWLVDKRLCLDLFDHWRLVNLLGDLWLHLWLDHHRIWLLLRRQTIVHLVNFRDFFDLMLGRKESLVEGERLDVQWGEHGRGFLSLLGGVTLPGGCWALCLHASYYFVWPI